MILNSHQMILYYQVSLDFIYSPSTRVSVSYGKTHPDTLKNFLSFNFHFSPKTWHDLAWIVNGVTWLVQRDCRGWIGPNLSYQTNYKLFRYMCNDNKWNRSIWMRGWANLLDRPNTTALNYVLFIPYRKLNCTTQWSRKRLMLDYACALWKPP